VHDVSDGIEREFRVVRLISTRPRRHLVSIEQIMVFFVHLQPKFSFSVPPDCNDVDDSDYVSGALDLGIIMLTHAYITMQAAQTAAIGISSLQNVKTRFSALQYVLESHTSSSKFAVEED
jgi:hypothetical protein